MKIKYIILMMLVLLTAEVISQDHNHNHVSLPVSGACGMCQETIESVANNMPGVISSEYDLDKQILLIHSDKEIDMPILSRRLSLKGYDNELSRAPQNIYDALPGCCMYREIVEHSIYEAKVLPPVAAIVSKTITGTVLEALDDGTEQALIGATVRWLNAPTGDVTDMEGKFEIGRIAATSLLEISYVGFKTDTIDVSQSSEVRLVMNGNLMLDDLVITHRSSTSEISFVKPIQTVVVSEEELCKAACCNLSESFETSPAIDVSFTDAVTGTRQIQMLGLAGKYVQITRELIPEVRGLVAIQGLTFTPGHWIESIQLSKGAGSVASGYESMTGQINLELRKPELKDNMAINLYGNTEGRYEGNLFIRQKLNKNWSTGFLLHGATKHKKSDHDDDGFIDSPLQETYVAVNRWKYQSKNGWQGQLGFKMVMSEMVAGQSAFNKKTDRFSDTVWGSHSQYNRNEIWTKIGKVLSQDKNSSFGFQFSYADFNQKSVYGLKGYEADQKSIYANLLYQSELASPEHMYKVGLSYVGEDYDELVEGDRFLKEEQVPGAFGEYTWRPTDNFTLVGGARLDMHNDYGLQMVERLHVRYAFNEELVGRIAIGKGWRSANIFSETPGYFASSRNYRISGEDNSKPFGLDLEESWNLGVNVTKGFYVNNRKGTISLDYYYTDFSNQIIADFESSNDGTVIFANQNGESYGHSMQAQVDVELAKNLDVRVAYRYNYASAMYGSERKAVALNPFHKAFINVAYKAPKEWYIDFTLNWRGEQRIPDTNWLPEHLEMDSYSQDYFLANTQIRKLFKDDFEIYIGMENIFDFTQDDPIVSASTPFASSFDASLIWGPLHGRKVYFGMRHKLN